MNLNGTWGWPLLLAVLTIFGLAAGIFGDGVWDWLCWAGLAVPVWVVVVKLRAHRRTS